MSLQMELLRKLEQLRRKLAERRNNAAVPRPLDWDALVSGEGGGGRPLPAGLFERSPVADPVDEAVARASAGRGGGP
jgi:hypothetical protein